MQNNKDYEKYTFLNQPSFVISNLENSLSTRKSKHENQVFSIIMAATAITIFVILTTLSKIMAITGLHPLVIVIIYITIAMLITWRIVATVQYHIDDVIRERTTNYNGNVQFDLASAWRITPGGIQEDVDIGNGGNKGTVIVNYNTKAIFIKGIMRGTVDGADGDDLKHYKTLQQLQDIAFKNGYELIKINIPYDTNNDPIWEIETERIHKAAELGDTYLKLRTQLHETVYNFTKKNSTVTVTYFILKATMTARVQPQVIASEIIRLKQHCIMELAGVSMAELKTMMEIYYGVSISIEDILSFMTITSTSLGECKIISYALENGELIQENEVYEYNIPSVFLTSEIVTDFRTQMEEQESEDIKSSSIPVLEIGDIFTREYI